MSYPTVAQVFDIARIGANDTFAGATNTPGEGRILVNEFEPVMLNFLNLAIAHYVRDLENGGVPSPVQRQEAILTPLTPINSASGVGVPNPGVQQYLGFNGFFDGLNLNTGLTLPANMLSPIKLYQRTSGTGLTFQEMFQAPDGLASLYQDFQLGNWEWRQDALYFNGSLVTMDLRLRYTGSAVFIPTTTLPVNFPTTLINLQDSAEALGLWIAYIFCEPRLPPGGAQELKLQYKEVVGQIINRYIKMKQRSGYSRQDYGDGNESWAGLGGFV